VQTFAKRHRLVASIEEHSPPEVAPGLLAEGLQTLEVRLIHGGGALHLNADDAPPSILENEIYLPARVGAEVKYPRAHRAPRDLLDDFHDNEVLEGAPQRTLVRDQAISINPQQVCHQSDIDHDQFPGLHEPLTPVAEPRGQRLDQVASLEQRQISLERLPGNPAAA